MTIKERSSGEGCSGDPRHHFSPELLYTTARQYYLEDVNQAAIAARLGTSRTTVSRMLSMARRTGMVRIEVNPAAGTDTAALAARTAELLTLDAVHVMPTVPEGSLGSSLGAGVSSALRTVGLEPGDVLTLSSGRTVYDVTQASSLPRLAGIEVAPMIGGQDEPDAWYQTNEIVRLFAAGVSGHPSFLYAPALPGPELYKSLMNDATITRVIGLWKSAKCAIVGVGPPPLSRASIPRFVSTDSPSLRLAIGDICSRFYDRDGVPIAFPGSDRLISTDLDDLRSIPTTIAVAAGDNKIVSIATAARAGYFTQLVTDAATATGLVAHVLGKPLT